jgi:hypothetical protein
MSRKGQLMKPTDQRDFAFVYETEDGDEALIYLVRRHQPGDPLEPNYVIVTKKIKVLEGDEIMQWWALHA